MAPPGESLRVKAGVEFLQCESCVIHTWALQRWVPYYWALYKCLSLPFFTFISDCDMWNVAGWSESGAVHKPAGDRQDTAAGFRWARCHSSPERRHSCTWPRHLWALQGMGLTCLCICTFARCLTVCCSCIFCGLSVFVLRCLHTKFSERALINANSYFVVSAD